ncbi:hypothetical protein J6590_070076 [Homalodisca vitripennis]|nr:hypothetical protein J6590_070076 [Homalodisca vitripennis]
MAVVGCILVYTAVILLGLDHATLPSKAAFPTVCTARVYLLSAGFSLAFGSMFTKTYRVHRIFTRSASGVVKNKKTGFSGHLPSFSDTKKSATQRFKICNLMSSSVCGDLTGEDIVAFVQPSNSQEDEAAEDDEDARVERDRPELSTKDAREVIIPKLLQDTQLISLICVLLVIDGLIVTLWVAVDPMQRQLRNLTLEISSTDRSVVYQPQVEVCGSQFTHSWLGALYAYKGLLLIVGVYMAWETRHVKIPALNDSQYIGLSVYSVVITSALVVVLANLISERATLAFVTITALILTSTTTSLCLLFLPKIHAILHNRDSTADPVTYSMGLKIECNTRRFLIDDRREVYYRVEVQNRVYRREISVLDNEISKLEKALTSDQSVASSSHSSVVSRKEDPPPPRGPLPPTSVGGTLPMLLLSVLPPVIPRASWPSAEHCVLSHGVTFSSEPHLDEVAQGSQGSLRGDPGEDPSKLSVFGKLLNMLGPSRKTSSVSYAGGTGGIAAALKVHMGYIAGLVPSNKSRSSSLDSSNTSRYCVKKDDEEVCSRRISRMFSREDSDEDSPQTHARSSQSLSHRVSFSIQHQNSQPVLKVRGSPRFPHRIVPTCSLDALEERLKTGNLEPDFSRKNNHFQPQRNCQPPHRSKCRSLEDASSPGEEISRSNPQMVTETDPQ